MKKIIALVFILSSIPVFGQNHFIGLKGGINLTNIVSDNFLSKSGFRNGFTGGFTYEYQFENKFNVGLDFLYAQKGFTYDLIFTDELGNQFGPGLRTQYNHDYFSLPIKGGYSIGRDFKGFLNLGVVPSFLISAQEIVPGIGSVNGSFFDVSNGVRKFDFGGLIEIGGNYQLEERFSLFASVAYQQSFTSIIEGDSNSSWSARHHGMTVSAGIKYAL